MKIPKRMTVHELHLTLKALEALQHFEKVLGPSDTRRQLIASYRARLEAFGVLPYGPAQQPIEDDDI